MTPDPTPDPAPDPTPDLTPELRQSLEDHVRIWRVDPVGHTETLVRVARGASDGAGLASLRAVAEQGEDVSRTGLGRLVAAVVDELGLEEASGVDAQEAAVRAMAGRLLAGEISPRELTYWVTRVVGLRGGRGAQELMALEQEYCDRLGDDDVSDLDGRVHQAATAVLHRGSDAAEQGRARGFFRRRGRRKDPSA